MHAIVAVEKRDELDEELLEVGMSVQTGDEICDRAIEEANDRKEDDSEVIIIKLEDDPADSSITEFELLHDEDNPEVKKLSFKAFYYL
ncbi:hypothetical protein [Oceanobacillus sojae]|uniref:hypothetical protein n=1 Tax=Oceanobacillus sojae TaxID=582851 RepID=UPI0021A45893|nr:hypothetical protein [Oceanobacillus sojae]MCT1905131.1 hypothetical protein [Oceanobacillus sojae]